MSLDNFIQIINGKLLNKPDISSFNQIENQVSKITTGDLFIASNEDEIKEAVQKGAYVIISDFEPTIIDDEIAWILVDDIQNVLKRVLRYRLLRSDLDFYYLQDIEYEIAYKSANCDSILFLGEDMFSNYKRIVNNQKNLKFIISYDKKLLQDIYPDFTTIEESKLDIRVISKTLFTISIIYNDHFYENIQLSSLFIKQLNSVVNFFDNLGIKYDLKKISPIKHFHPIFLSKQMHLREFGHSQKVLICENCKELLELEFEYLKKEAPWAKIALQDHHLYEKFDEKLKKEIQNVHILLIYADAKKLISSLQLESKIVTPKLL